MARAVNRPGAGRYRRGGFGISRGAWTSKVGGRGAAAGPAWALRPADWIYSSYREIGSAFYRGYPLRTFLCQLFGNSEEPAT